MPRVSISIPATITLPMQAHLQDARRHGRRVPRGRRKRTPDFALSGKLQLTYQIVEHRLSGGRCPSLRELAKELGITAAAVRKRLMRLEELGYITRERGKTRNIRLT